MQSSAFDLILMPMTVGAFIGTTGGTILVLVVRAIDGLVGVGGRRDTSDDTLRGTSPRSQSPEPKSSARPIVSSR